MSGSRVRNEFIGNRRKIRRSAQYPGLTHEKYPRKDLGASDKNARETVTVVRHGKWVVDDVSCRDHHQVREGVCEGVQEGQGKEVTGWSRDNARRRLSVAAKRPSGPGRSVAKQPRKPRAPKYCYDTLKVLQKVWAAPRPAPSSSPGARTSTTSNDGTARRRCWLRTGKRESLLSSRTQLK